MFELQVACAVILLLNYSVALWLTPRRGVLLWRVGVLATASWIAEDTCIRAYAFYSYNPAWWGFIDQMPVMIALIWPAVILSAWELAWALRRRDTRATALLAGALVLADASLIEPIAVASGLWRWYEPGFFGVPPIGVLGWAFFAATCVLIFDANDRRRRGPGADLLVLLLAPLVSHAALLAAWWGALRWVSAPLDGAWVAALAWVVALLLTGLAVRHRAWRRVPPGTMLTRIPAALFFFGLLVLNAHDHTALIVFALAFAPPYLAITPWGSLRQGLRPPTARRLSDPATGSA